MAKAAALDDSDALEKFEEEGKEKGFDVNGDDDNSNGEQVEAGSYGGDGYGHEEATRSSSKSRRKSTGPRRSREGVRVTSVDLGYGAEVGAVLAEMKLHGLEPDGTTLNTALDVLAKVSLKCVGLCWAVDTSDGADEIIEA